MRASETISTRFRTTRWTEIVAAPADPAQLERLLARYWRPIYAYLRRSGRGREDAADLTQAFILEVVLGRELIERADPARGRFRSLLLTALQRFLIDTHRRDSASRRAPERLVALVDLDSAEPEPDASPEDAFQRQWAAEVVRLAVDRVESDCMVLGMELHWRAFEMRVLTPAHMPGEAPSVDRIAAHLGLESADIASKMIYSVKRRFRATFEQVVRETLADDGALADEIDSLRGLLPLT